MNTPIRIQLSRKKGWRKPPNTIVVARPSKWGNPFIVGKHGTRQQCCRLFYLLLTGHLCISVDLACIASQKKLIAHARNHLRDLRGKNLACWCPQGPFGTPCHAQTLIELANA